jgi:hypothetical protein
MKINFNNLEVYLSLSVIKIMLWVVTFPVMLSAQSPSLIRVRAEVDKSQITIGDRIVYTLTIEYQKDIHIEQPGPGANLGQFEIKDYSISEITEQDDFVKQLFNYTISVFDTGKFVIPPFPVAFFMSDTSKEYSIIQSEPLEIFVKSVLNAEDSELRDIKPPQLIPINYRKWILIGVAGLLVLSAILLLFYIMRQKKKGLPFFKKKLIRPAHEIAFEELEVLQHNLIDRINAGDHKQFFTELSNILRKYLENRFYIQALEETTSEIENSMDEVGVDATQQEKALEALNLSDVVKFAKYSPNIEEAENTVILIRKFVDETKLVFEAVDKMVRVEQKEPSLSETSSENVSKL